MTIMFMTKIYDLTSEGCFEPCFITSVSSVNFQLLNKRQKQTKYKKKSTMYLGLEKIHIA